MSKQTKLIDQTDIEVTGDDVDVYETFDEMGLKENLLRGIYSYGYEKPSLIQKRGIVPLFKGRDLIAQSQSGTGKTATFSIGMLQKMDESLCSLQCIVLSPTRELANQTYTVISALKSMTEIQVSLVIGGAKRYNFGNPEKSHVIVATPGRVFDMLEKKILTTTDLSLLILDEADEMLSRGFVDQVKQIFSYIDNGVQIALFSATMPPEILDITTRFMNDPIKILVNNNDVTLDGIAQHYIALDKMYWKFETLIELYQAISITQCIIYCNKTKNVIELTNKMLERDFAVDCIYGSMSQEERNKIMEDFRSGRTRVLIATDIIARGIDVQQVSLVINYDFPDQKETYIHRIGRSGRFGRKGVAINLIGMNSDEFRRMKALARDYNTTISELPSNFEQIINS